MEFKKYLDLNAQKVEKALDKILSEFLIDAKKISPKLLPLAKGFINSCTGGKRIRGVLVKLGYEIAAENTLKESKPTFEVETTKVGAALEILHAAILIHDDVIDESHTRRGNPTLYKALRPKDGRVGGDHYGKSQAIVLGDIGLYLPLKIITDSNFDMKYKVKAISYLSQTIVNTGWGQVLDIMAEKDYVLLYKLKTAYYTIAGPLILGAILAGAQERMIGVLEEFGENLGIAFQIKDDILDGESTLLGLAQAVEYALKARKMIPKITGDQRMSELLEHMCEYLVQRKT